jgi:hypothetical protein
VKKLFADLYIARGYDVSEVRADTVYVWVGRGACVERLCGLGGCGGRRVFVCVCNGWFE